MDQPKEETAVAAQHWKLRLYIEKDSDAAILALSNLKRICDLYIEGVYSIEIIDILARPQLTAKDQIMLTPTLVRLFPLPERKLVGPLDEPNTVLAVLGLGPYMV